MYIYALCNIIYTQIYHMSCVYWILHRQTSATICHPSPTRRGADELVQISIPLPALQWLSILVEDCVTVDLPSGKRGNLMSQKSVSFPATFS